VAEPERSGWVPKGVFRYHRAMIESIHIDAVADQGVLVVRLKCEKISEYESTIVQNEVLGLAKGFHYKVALDFKAVQMIASVGLGMLTVLNKQCKASKGKLALFGLNENLKMVLKVTSMDRLFVIVPDQPAAVKAVL
jgi:anti-sigma B factor antagonist